jgi:hypothetical protein
MGKPIFLFESRELLIGQASIVKLNGFVVLGTFMWFDSFTGKYFLNNCLQFCGIKNSVVFFDSVELHSRDIVTFQPITKTDKALYMTIVMASAQKKGHTDFMSIIADY